MPMLLSNESEARAFVQERCSVAACDNLDALRSQLIAHSASQNLISAGTKDQVWCRHIADSAQLLDHVSHETGTWVDFGSGAGFPGLVIAIMQPDRPVTLVESRSLRIQWLNDMIDRFALKNCHVLGVDARRVESFGAGVISARAFAPLPPLIAVCARFSTNATQWVLPKGRSAEQDVAMLPSALRERFHVEQSVTSSDAGIIVGRGRIEP